MTRTRDEEKEQQAVLEQQQAEVSVGGVAEVLRPEALHIRGVDSLSTEDITTYIDYYANYTRDGDTFVAREDPVRFRVQWIDDANVNAVFKTHREASDVLRSVCAFSGATPDGALPAEYVAQLVEEREAYAYAPTLALRRYLQQQEEDLFAAKKEQAQQQSAMDEDDSSVVLHVRVSLQLDRKVKNAAAYLRYYLLHGEPDRTRPRRPANGRRSRGNYARDDGDDEDLFAAKLKSTGGRSRDDEEDLFASRMRERSPSRR